MHNRRDLIRSAALAASSYARVWGANDRVRGALIGCGNRGVNSHLVSALALDVDVRAVCDVYAPQIDRALTRLATKPGGKADSFTDYRKVLERRDIDVVFIATPDHWHAPITIAACQAGKDVFVEKPLAHSPEECLAIADAVKQSKRIVQVGLQQRSMKIYHDALEMLRGGVIGRVDRCEMAWGSSSTGPRAADPVTTPPDGLDWEAFQGSAPRMPYRATRQRSWRHYFEYGDGTITDFGVHLLDVARWFLDLGAPVSSYGSGHRSPARTVEQVPDIVQGVWRFDRAMVTYASRHSDMLNRFWGERGTLDVSRSVIRTALFEGGGQPKELRVSEPGFENTGLSRGAAGDAVHVKNFLDCVRSRQRPNGDVERVVLSNIACLLGSRSMRSGKSYSWSGDHATEI